MAIMIATRVLHGDLSGGALSNPLPVKVMKGTLVEIVDATQPNFLKIRATPLDGQPVGWVSETAVDKTAMAPPPLDGAVFAQTCIDHAAMFGVQGHLQMAVADMLTGLRDAKADNGVEQGPFAFTAAEWMHFGDRPDFDVTFAAEDIVDWRKQSLVAALRAMLVQNMLSERLNRQPSAAEAVLALMTGAKAAAAAIGSPDMPMDTISAAINTNDPEAAEADKANIPLRFGKYLSGKTAKEAVAAVEAALQTSLDATRGRFTAPDVKPVESADKPVVPVFPGTDASVTIPVTNEDIEALAWVANSEVGHFAKYGKEQLAGGLAGVVDTIFNRVAHKSFPATIQGVIDQKFQFSAINKLGSWKRLHENASLLHRQQAIFDIVATHVSARLAGAPGVVSGGTHFLNPFVSSPGPLRQWGNFVVAHAVAEFGNRAKKDVHFHGTAPGVGKPRDYLLNQGMIAAHFDSDGKPMPAAVTAPAEVPPALVTGGSIQERIIALCLAEWEFFNKGQAKEAEDPQFKRIGEYWKAVGEVFDGRSMIKGDKAGTLINPAWSSAFISFIVKNAGGGDRFKYSQAHFDYVQDFAAGRPGGLYEAKRPEAFAPAPGDIIHSGREEAKNFDFDAAGQRFRADKRYASHSDFVIAVDMGARTLTSIGGNVTQSVAKKILKLNSDGTLKNRVEGGHEQPWIAVLKCMG